MAERLVRGRMLWAVATALLVVLSRGTGAAGAGSETASPPPLRLRIGGVVVTAGPRGVVAVPPGAMLCVARAEEGGGRPLVLSALDVTVPPGGCTPPLWRRGDLDRPAALLAYGGGLPDRDVTLYLVADPGGSRSAGRESKADPGASRAAAAVAPAIAPCRRLEQPPEAAGVEAIPLLGGAGLLYRRRRSGDGPEAAWLWGAVPLWRAAGLVDLREVDPTLRIDLRYASADNFLHRRIYPRPLPLLRRPAAAALVAANHFLHRYGLGLCVWDAYRPLSVQRLMWRALPDRRYVADPHRRGSAHNRGIAVDVTLVTTRGKPLAVPTQFDAFSRRAWHTARKGLSREQRFDRQLLRAAMELHGFRPLRTEWWHYTYALDNAASLDVPLE